VHGVPSSRPCKYGRGDVFVGVLFARTPSARFRRIRFRHVERTVRYATGTFAQNIPNRNTSFVRDRAKKLGAGFSPFRGDILFVKIPIIIIRGTFRESFCLDTTGIYRRNTTTRRHPSKISASRTFVGNIYTRCGPAVPGMDVRE